LQVVEEVELMLILHQELWEEQEQEDQVEVEEVVQHQVLRELLDQLILEVEVVVLLQEQKDLQVDLE
jgi:hypothetical protein